MLDSSTNSLAEIQVVLFFPQPVLLPIPARTTCNALIPLATYLTPTMYSNHLKLFPMMLKPTSNTQTSYAQNQTQDTTPNMHHLHHNLEKDSSNFIIAFLIP